VGEVAGAQLVNAALDNGITLLDTADIYGFNGNDGFGDAESLLGQILKASPHLRERMVLASKGGIIPGVPYDNSGVYISTAIEMSLMRLGTDQLDLWQIHRPDSLTHPQEMAKALTAAVASGKIRAIGVSNMTLAQITALQHFLDLPIASTQPELSPLCLAPITDGSLDNAMMQDMAVMAWSPLGGGRIAEPQTARELAVAAALDEVATGAGVSRSAAAYGWIMAHPARPIPIIGSQKPERIAEAMQALTLRWTRQSWYAVLVASRGEKLP
jgi:predicted oxidoreductase